MDYKDYYAVLGVPRTASDKEIKKAFRKLAREHHPDVKGGDAAADKRFKEVNEAYDILKDGDKLTRAGVIDADLHWERITYFLERVVPVAESNRVRLACHPHDPYTPSRRRPCLLRPSRAWA